MLMLFVSVELFSRDILLRTLVDVNNYSVVSADTWSLDTTSPVYGSMTFYNVSWNSSLCYWKRRQLFLYTSLTSVSFRAKKVRLLMSLIIWSSFFQTRILFSQQRLFHEKTDFRTKLRFKNRRSSAEMRIASRCLFLGNSLLDSFVKWSAMKDFVM